MPVNSSGRWYYMRLFGLSAIFSFTLIWGWVAAIPMAAFCDPPADDWARWNHLVRFTFCKRDDTLDEAIRRLGKLRDRPAIPTGSR